MQIGLTQIVPKQGSANGLTSQKVKCKKVVSYLAVPIRILVPISVPIYTKNDIDKIGTL